MRMMNLRSEVNTTVTNVQLQMLREGLNVTLLWLWYWTFDHILLK